MDRKLLIFGNGLGMALDSEHFALQRALQDVWEKPDYLTPEQKVLIEHCYGHTGAPEGEHELETLYQAVTYCNGLVSIGDTSLCQDSCHPLNLNQESGKDTIYGPLFTRA